MYRMIDGSSSSLAGLLVAYNLSSSSGSKNMIYERSKPIESNSKQTTNALCISQQPAVMELSE
jgi:hypothetical protein